MTGLLPSGYRYPQTTNNMRQFFLIFGLLVLLIATITLLQPSREHEPKPWDILIMPDGNSRVFNLHLGHSSLEDAQRQFNDHGEVAVFSKTGGQEANIEAYFNSVNLAGLSAKVILTFNVPNEEITAILTRTINPSQQESGSIKYELLSSDLASMASKPIKAIDYIPSVTVDQATIEHRFGQAKQIKHTDKSNNQIWFYPDINLKVFFNEGNKTIFHYHIKDKS